MLHRCAFLSSKLFSFINSKVVPVQHFFHQCLDMKFKIGNAEWCYDKAGRLGRCYDKVGRFLCLKYELLKLN